MTQTNEQRDNAIAKIRKLLALAADMNAAPGEQDNAARMAASLMTKFQIDESVVLASSGAEVTIRCGFAYAKHMHKGLMQHPKWTGVIALGVAEYLGCVTALVVAPTDNPNCIVAEQFKFSGEINDVSFAVWLTETLIVAARRAWMNADTEETEQQYLLGFACALQGRLRDMVRIRKEVEAEMKASDSTALVVLDKKAVTIADKFGGQKNVKQIRAKAGHDGYRDGKKHVIPTGALEAAKQAPQLK